MWLSVFLIFTLCCADCHVRIPSQSDVFFLLLYIVSFSFISFCATKTTSAMSNDDVLCCWRLCVCSCSVHVLWSVQVAQPIFITKKNDFFKRISYHLFVFDKMNTIQFIMVAPLHIDTQLDSLEMPKKHATDAAFNSSYCNNQILWLRAA